MRQQSIRVGDVRSGGLSHRSRGWLWLGIGLFLLAGIFDRAYAAVPVITAQPTNQTVLAGNNVTFSVTATGTLLGYQWYQNGTSLPLGGGSSYTVLGATATAAGNYTVIVSSLGSSVTSSPALLTVTPIPATIIISNLLQTYNGGPISVTVNSGLLNFGVTYNGNNYAPTNVGSYTVIATILSLTYVGSVTNTLVVAQSGTTNVLTASANPVPTGSNVTFTATLIPVAPGGGVPTGNVVFKDGTNIMGTVALNGADVATFSTTTLSHRSHTINAGYAGDGNFTGSTNSLSELIDSAPVVVTQTWPRTPNASLKIRTAVLLAGDTDADNDPLSLVSVGATSTAGGAVTISGSWILYAPPTGYTNTDSFACTIADNYGLQSTGTVSVAVFAGMNATPNIGSMLITTNVSAVILFNDIPGRTYAVQYASNLTAPSWQPLGTATADVTGKFNFTDSTATNSLTRYYRSLN